MIAGASLALEAGNEVRGSDNPLYPPTSEMIKQLGVTVYEGYDAKNLDWNPDVVIIGNALSRGNPEVEAILQQRLNYQSLPEWLKQNVLRQRKPIAICGTHGKTTVTALTAYLLEQAGLSPGYLIGGQPLCFNSSSKLGAPGAPFVIEGDEYDTAFFDKRAKFFHYLPQIAVVTSIEFDHGDIYSTYDEIFRAFSLMLRQIPANGYLIACGEDAGSRKLTDHSFSNTILYGWGEECAWRGVPCEANPGFQGLKVYREGRFWAKLNVPLFGRHNLLNTLASLAVAGTLNVPTAQIEKALPEFRGVRRRMEIFLKARDVTFIDDFAHHPTAIRETIAAVKTAFPGRVIVLLEPRSNTMVTNRFQNEIENSLCEANVVWIGAIHREQQIPPEMRLNRAQITANLSKRGIEAHFSDSIQEIVDAVINNSQAGDVVLILSNGSFHGIYDKFKEALGDRS